MAEAAPGALTLDATALKCGWKQATRVLNGQMQVPGSPLFAFPGKLTFALYLTHVLVINVVERGLETIGGHRAAGGPVVDAYALSVTFAAMLHYAIERPMIGVGRKLSANIRQGTPEASPAGSSAETEPSRPTI